MKIKKLKERSEIVFRNLLSICLFLKKENYLYIQNRFINKGG